MKSFIQSITDSLKAEMIGGPKDGAVVDLTGKFVAPKYLKFNEEGATGFAVHLYKLCERATQIKRELVYTYVSTNYHKEKLDGF
jgi:hypothetical protein